MDIVPFANSVIYGEHKRTSTRGVFNDSRCHDVLPRFFLSLSLLLPALPTVVTIPATHCCGKSKRSRKTKMAAVAIGAGSHAKSVRQDRKRRETFTPVSAESTDCQFPLSRGRIEERDGAGVSANDRSVGAVCAKVRARAVDRTRGRSPAGGRTRTERSSRTFADPLSRSHVPSFRLLPPARRAPCVVRRHSATLAPSRSSRVLPRSLVFLSLFLSFSATARPPLRHIAAERARMRRRGHARGRKTR